MAYLKIKFVRILREGLEELRTYHKSLALVSVLSNGVL